MTTPIEMVNSAFGQEEINSDVKKIVTINAIPNRQNFLALARGFGDLINWARLVNRSGKNKRGIALVGSIIRVKNAIAAAGNPNPRKPFTIPEIKNTISMKKSKGSSVVGSRYENV